MCLDFICFFAASRSHADEDDDSEGDQQMDDEAHIKASDCLFSHYDNAHRLAICLLVLQGVRDVRSSSSYCCSYESEFLHGYESLTWKEVRVSFDNSFIVEVFFDKKESNLPSSHGLQWFCLTPHNLSRVKVEFNFRSQSRFNQMIYSPCLCASSSIRDILNWLYNGVQWRGTFCILLIAI